MTIEVATPDGSIAEFPDGTHPDQIRNAMRAKFGGGPAKGVADDISKMSAGDIAKTAVSNIPSSAAEFAKNTAQPFIHPVETAENLGSIGKGVLQKLGVVSGDDATKYADAVGKFLMDRYGSVDAIKRTIATDPVGLAADLSLVLTGGGSLLARAGGVAGKVGKVAAEAGRIVDPLTAAGAAVKTAGKGAATVLGVTTGAGSDAIKIAAEAGKEGGASAKAFREHLMGTAPSDEIVNDAKAAVGKLRRDRGQLYRDEMQKIGADTTVINFSRIDSAVQQVANVKTYKGQSLSPSTEKIRQSITDAVTQWKTLPPQDFHTAEGLDALKQKVGDIRDATQFGTPDRVVADGVYHAIRKSIADNVPEYAKVMKGYEQASDLIREMEKTLSLKPGTSIDTSLRKLQSVLRDNVNTNYGKRKELAEFLVRSGAPHLLQKIAGTALAAAVPRGLMRAVVGGEGLAAGGLALAGHPGVALGLGAGLLASSPALVGAAAHGVGMASRLPLRKIGRSAFQTGRVSDQAN